MNNNNNNAAPSRRRGRKRGRNGGGSAAQPAQQPAQKKQKTGRRQRKRAARNGRAMSQRGDQLTGKGLTKNSTTNRSQMVVEEDEYVAEVTVANEPNFNVQQYSVNPGQAATFPWLSTLAKNFEKYEFEYLEFYYKREVSEYATNGQVGKVMMSFDTDASDNPPATKAQLEATDPHEDGLPSENIALVIPSSMLCQKLDAWYVRPGGVPPGADVKTYDVGNLNVATIGINNNVAVGELHVRYRCVLSIPVLENAIVQPAKSTAQFLTAGIASGSTPETGGTTGVAVGLLVASVQTNGLGAVNTAGSIVPPAGNYLVSAEAFVEDTALTSADLYIAKNGTNLIRAQWNVAAGAVVAIATLNAQMVISCNGTDAITFPVAATFGGGGTTDVWGSVILQMIA